MASTAETIIGYARNQLRVDGSSTDLPALQDDHMLQALNLANAEWLRTFKRYGEPPRERKSEYGIDIIAQTTLSADQASGATTASLTSSSSFPSSGAIVVYDDGMPDIELYTGNAANVLSGVTGVNWGHESGDQVSCLYALPSTFGTMRSTTEAPEGVTVNSIPYFHSPDNPQTHHYSLYVSGSTTYLWLPLGLSGSARVVYNSLRTTIDEVTDEVDVPVEYENFLVWRLVEHGAISKKDDPNLPMYAKAKGDEVMRQALQERNVTRLPNLRPIQRNGRLSQNEYYMLTQRD